MTATALAVAALSVAGTLLTREEAEEWSPVWLAHRHLRLQPQSLRARGAKAARALLAATGWMQVSCWRASFEAYDPLAEPAPAPRGAAASPEAAWHQVSQFETNFNSRFRVSGFGFRSALGKLSLQSRFRVSGFGFRVSIGPGEVKPSGSVSGFGFRSVLGKGLQSRFQVSGFGLRVSGFDRSWGS